MCTEIIEKETFLINSGDEMKELNANKGEKFLDFNMWKLEVILFNFYTSKNRVGIAIQPQNFSSFTSGDDISV